MLLYFLKLVIHIILPFFIYRKIYFYSLWNMKYSKNTLSPLYVVFNLLNSTLTLTRRQTYKQTKTNKPLPAPLSVLSRVLTAGWNLPLFQNMTCLLFLCMVAEDNTWELDREGGRPASWVQGQPGLHRVLGHQALYYKMLPLRKSLLLRQLTSCVL